MIMNDYDTIATPKERLKLFCNAFEMEVLGMKKLWYASTNGQSWSSYLSSSKWISLECKLLLSCFIEWAARLFEISPWNWMSLERISSSNKEKMVE